MGGSDGIFGKLMMIAVAIFAPYMAASLGLTGLSATLFSAVAQGLVGAIFGGSSKSSSTSGTGDTGLLINGHSATGSIRLIYGERRIGGQRIFIDTTDGDGGQTGGEDAADRDMYLHSYFSIAEGEIESINAMIFNDRIAWIKPSIISVTDNVYYVAANEEETISHTDWAATFDDEGRAHHYEDDSNNSLIEFAYWHGTDTQTGDSPNFNTSLVTDWRSDEWTNEHRCASTAIALLRLTYNRKQLPQTPNVLFDIDGKKVTDLYSNVVSTERAERWNPANCLYDYLTSDRYGKGLSPSDIDIESFRTHRAYCFCKGLEVNGALDPSLSIFDNTQFLLSAGNAFLVFSNGKYKIKPMSKLDFSDAFEFSKDNIVDAISIALGSKRNRNNRVTVNYFDPSIGWQPNFAHLPPTDVEGDTNFVDFLEADNGVINETRIDLALTADEYHAKRIAYSI
jgi:hypothetical protein